MFDKILIANRGEIACRVARTARRLGIRVVAVYSDADRDALHVRAADEAYPIGAAPAEDSYLRGEVIIEVARRAGAQAVHPGYGFLAENADFAQACADVGLTFIGPSPEAIRAMGSKTNAKKLMTDADVPILPGYHEDNLDLRVIETAARKIGYPVLVKASAGGGGRGMRVVERDLDLAEAMASARREAKAAFGDDHVLIEKYVLRPRHIEVQIFADSHGNVVHMFERDCSVQRRYQKVIEEAPAPGLTDALRRRLGDTAIAVARAVDYVGAGTVEFIVDRDDNHYFLEMNTRLQVEHAVTEMITGQDLVEWQLRVAAGESLPCQQSDLTIHGHAVEARLYAEDPARDFLPVTGQLTHFRPPEARDGLRIDTGVGPGDQVSAFYDPMIAKIVAWDRDRSAALRCLGRALTEFQVAGVVTNLTFLAAVLRHPSFVAEDVDTSFIDRHRKELIPEPRATPDRALAVALLYLLTSRARNDAVSAPASDPYSPWALSDGWRMNEDPQELMHLIDGEDEVTIPVRGTPEGYVFHLADGEMRVSGALVGETELEAELDGERVRATVARHGSSLTIWLGGQTFNLETKDPLALGPVEEEEGGRLTAPMPGRITRVFVDDGDQVERGAALVVLEAMKMEHTIAAPADGRVDKVNFAVGEWVDEGVALLDFSAKA